MIVNLYPADADMFAALMTTPSAIDSREQMLVALKAMFGKRHEPFRAGPEGKYAMRTRTRFAPSLRSWPSPRGARSGRSSDSLSDLIPAGTATSLGNRPH